MTKYPQVFYGIGKLNDFQLHLHIDDSVTPVAQAPRRIPSHIRKAVQAKLDELETLQKLKKFNSKFKNLLTWTIHLAIQLFYRYAT